MNKDPNFKQSVYTFSKNIPEDIRTFLIDTAEGDLNPLDVGHYTDAPLEICGERRSVFEIDSDKLDKYIKNRKVEKI